jgi:photosystem II stability/assembly factor-like uncharacterized protein
VVDPTDPDVLYAADSFGVSKSADGGASWSRLGAVPGGREVHAITIDPREPSRIYAGTSSAGVIASTDGGATWQALRAGLPGNEIDALLLAGSGRLFAGTGGAGVAVIDPRG